MFIVCMLNIVCIFENQIQGTMTTLQSLHAQISKEKRRIKMLKNTTSNGDATWYDFVESETKQAKNKIAELQKEFDKEYNLNN